MTTEPKQGNLPYSSPTVWKKDMVSQAIINNLFNPIRHYLSDEAQKRLRWMYVIERECDHNVTRAAKKIGLSREWLTKLHRKFVQHGRDPRTLEPGSRAPHNCSKRKHISKKQEDALVEVREQNPYLGEQKIVRILERDHAVTIGSTTVNRYLHKHQMIDPKLSDKNVQAWKKRKQKSSGPRLRPPLGLEDAAPGSLIAKDQKTLGILGRPFIVHGKIQAWYQHTLIDSCTRWKTLSLVRTPDAETSKQAYEEAAKRFPFPVANLLSDNGSENDGVFDEHLQACGVPHFWSRPGTPTDNPRVERSHLADDLEFYARGNRVRSFEKQQELQFARENEWNAFRPHQALGQLTPQEYCELWKADRPQAVSIQRRWNDYLAKQSKRQRTARKERRQLEIDAINTHLANRLGASAFTPLKV